MYSDFFDRTASTETALTEELLEGVSEQGALPHPSAAPEVVSGFFGRTSALTFGEQAELLGGFVESQRETAARRPAAPRAPGRPAPSRGRPAPSRSPSRSGGGGFDFGSLSRGLQQGLSLFQTGAQVVGGLAGAFGGSNRDAQNVALWANRLGQGAGQVGGLLQALQGGQIPPLPGASMGGGVALPGLPVQPPASHPAPGGGAPFNATALLGLLMQNPQLQQALAAAPVLGTAGPRTVELNLPHRDAPVPIPLGAVMNTIASLAGQSMEELNASTREDDPEVPSYLLSEEGDLIVDPASPEERAALVLHYFRLAGEAARMAGSDGAEWDEADVFAREAGFDD